MAPTAEPNYPSKDQKWNLVHNEARREDVSRGGGDILENLRREVLFGVRGSEFRDAVFRVLGFARV